MYNSMLSWWAQTLRLRGSANRVYFPPQASSVSGLSYTRLVRGRSLA
jgi:hypothetical protein